jgi:predicted secreted hydrolase
MMRGVLALLLVGLGACRPTGSPESRALGTSSRSGQERGAPTGLRYLGGPAEDGFARATQPRDFVFPRDHGSHDEFRNEWWYFTGNLEDSDRRHFGFELTFFRIALAPPGGEPRASAWAARQVWMAHFAITDVQNGRVIADERFARGALGLGGATTTPFRVWVEDWSVSGEADARDARFTLRAQDARMAVSLEVEALKPVAVQGDRGLDSKGPEPGNASYYYSFPRLAVRGALRVDGAQSDVSGTAWMDREWSTSTLSAGVVGWEWFGVQLSDDRELMLYRLRQTDGKSSAYSGGSLVETDGTTTRLRRADVEFEPTEFWTSPRTHVRYAVAWRISIPAEGMTLSIEPLVRDQEINLSVRYWEGAVRVTGRAREGVLTGQGYLELAGY